MTVTIVGTVTARPECRDERAELLGEQVAPTRAEAGLLARPIEIRHLHMLSGIIGKAA